LNIRQEEKKKKAFEDFDRFLEEENSRSPALGVNPYPDSYWINRLVADILTPLHPFRVEFSKKNREPLVILYAAVNGIRHNKLHYKDLVDLCFAYESAANLPVELFRNQKKTDSILKSAAEKTRELYDLLIDVEPLFRNRALNLEPPLLAYNDKESENSGIIHWGVLRSSLPALAELLDRESQSGEYPDLEKYPRGMKNLRSPLEHNFLLELDALIKNKRSTIDAQRPLKAMFSLFQLVFPDSLTQNIESFRNLIKKVDSTISRE